MKFLFSLRSKTYLQSYVRLCTSRCFQLVASHVWPLPDLFLFVSSKFYQQVIFSRSWNLVFPLKQKWHQQVSGLGGKHIPLRKGDSVILCDLLVLHETWGVRSSMISSVFRWTLDGRIIMARPALGNKQLRSHFTTLGHLWMNIEP